MNECRNWRASVFSCDKAFSTAGVFSSLGCLKANRCWSFAMRKNRRIVPRCATRARWNIWKRRRAFRVSSIRWLFSTWFSKCCIAIEHVIHKNATVGDINWNRSLWIFIYLFLDTDSRGAMRVVRDFKTKITLVYHKHCQKDHLHLHILRTAVCSNLYFNKNIRNPK